MEPSSETSATAPQLTMTRPEPGTLLLRLTGAWRVGQKTPAAELVDRELDRERAERIAFDAAGVVAWDSALVVFATRVFAIARSARVSVDKGGLPAGVQRLLALVEGAPALARPPKPRAGLLARIGYRAQDHWRGT